MILRQEGVVLQSGTLVLAFPINSPEASGCQPKRAFLPPNPLVQPFPFCSLAECRLLQLLGGVFVSDMLRSIHLWGRPDAVSFNSLIDGSRGAQWHWVSKCLRQNVHAVHPKVLPGYADEARAHYTGCFRPTQRDSCNNAVLQVSTNVGMAALLQAGQEESCGLVEGERIIHLYCFLGSHGIPGKWKSSLRLSEQART